MATLAFGGVVGDRLPRRAVMIGSDTASFAVRTTMGVLLVAGHAHVWELIALQAVGGAAVAFYSPASYGLVPEVVRPELLQQANSYLAIARYAAFPLGAAAGGTIVAIVGSGTALLFDAGTYAASALLLSQLRVESVARAGKSFLHELREGWSAFVERTWVWVLCLWIALYFLITYAPFFVLGPYIAKHSMGGAGSWGAVVTGEGIGALLGSLAGLRFRPTPTDRGDRAALPADRDPERAARLPRLGVRARAGGARSPASRSRAARSSGTPRSSGRSRRRSSPASPPTAG